MIDPLRRFILHLSKINHKSYREILRTAKFIDNLALAFSESHLDYEELCASIDENAVAYNNMISIGYNWLLCLSVLYRTNGFKAKDKSVAFKADAIVRDNALVDTKYVNVSGYLKATNIYSTKMFGPTESTLGEYFCRKLLDCPLSVQIHFSEFVLVFMRKLWVRKYGYTITEKLLNGAIREAS